MIRASSTDMGLWGGVVLASYLNSSSRLQPLKRDNFRVF